MILSFHPCFEAHQNRLCAGRDPDARDLAVIRSADAVILPQGCKQALYAMARNNCRHVFPGYDARFAYPGKIGQSRLFKACRLPHPQTLTFSNTSAFFKRFSGRLDSIGLGFPLVFKFDWGGEGETVFLITSPTDLQRALQKAARYEQTGQSGFVLQAYVPCSNRTLRIVAINETLISYWRIQPDQNRFHANLAAGATIDAETDPDLRNAAIGVVKQFCHRSGINLAGIDLLFPAAPTGAKDAPDTLTQPLFLEINYFFGRRGLGGNEKFYALLNREIRRWLAGRGLTFPH